MREGIVVTVPPACLRELVALLPAHSKWTDPVWDEKGIANVMIYTITDAYTFVEAH